MPSVLVQTAERVHVADHGAKGDGVTDDWQAIQGAIAAALASKQPLKLDPKIYALSQPLVIDGFLDVIGAPRSGDAFTILKALAPMPTVLELRGNITYSMSELWLDANRLADHALRLEGCSFGNFDRIVATRARLDGVYLAKYRDNGAGAIDDDNRFTRLNAGGNGTFFCSAGIRSQYVVGEGGRWLLHEQALTVDARAATQAGSDTVAFDGLDLRTLALRPGDPVRIANGSARENFLIVAVLSETELRVLEPATATASNCEWAIGRGDGYHEEEGDGDNNLSHFEQGLFRANAGKALQIQGSYGCRVYGGNIEYCPFWGVLVGVPTPAYVCTSFDPLFVGTYFEDLKAKPFYLVSAVGLSMINMTGAGAAPLDDVIDTRYGVSATPFVRGMRIGGWQAEHIEPIGSGVRSTVPTTRTHDLYAENGVRVQAAIAQPINETGTNDWPQSMVVIRTGADDITLSGTPTIAPRAEKILYLVNQGPASVTLQDEDTLAGSMLKLREATVALAPYEAVQLICDGQHWIQVGP